MISTTLASEKLKSTEQFCFENKHLLKIGKIPNHIAIMPDGNRRWAKKHDLSIKAGYRAGADNLLSIVKAAKELGVKTITFYVFSTENWSRPILEVQTFMLLLESYLINERANMIQNGVKFRTIGNVTALTKRLQKAIQDSITATENCQDIEMVFAINYGARDEMRRAFQEILSDYDNGIISREEVTESMISSYLDTSNLEDPDLLIRTSGETRMSNFMLWQTSYAEFYTLDVLWPEFTPQHLLDAILFFQTRDRRLGSR